MRDLPTPIKDFILALTDDTLSPAYLLTSEVHGLVDWGGDVEAYGISNLKREINVGDSVPFLIGVLPLETNNLFLPNVETKEGVFANVYLFNREEGTWVLLLDSSADVAGRKKTQQKLYDSKLNAADLERENESLYKANVVLEDIVRQRTVELSETILKLQNELALRKKTDSL